MGRAEALVKWKTYGVSMINFSAHVRWLPLIGEIMWYLSFTNWLISLSIIFSSSTQAVANLMNKIN